MESNIVEDESLMEVEDSPFDLTISVDNQTAFTTENRGDATYTKSCNTSTDTDTSFQLSQMKKDIDISGPSVIDETIQMELDETFDLVSPTNSDLEDLLEPLPICDTTYNKSPSNGSQFVMDNRSLFKRIKNDDTSFNSLDSTKTREFFDIYNENPHLYGLVLGATPKNKNTQLPIETINNNYNKKPDENLSLPEVKKSEAIEVDEIKPRESNAVNKIEAKEAALKPDILDKTKNLIANLANVKTVEEVLAIKDALVKTATRAETNNLIAILADVEKLEEVIATQDAVANNKIEEAIASKEALAQSEAHDEMKSLLTNLGDVENLEELIAMQEALLKPYALGESKSLIKVKKTEVLTEPTYPVPEIKTIENLVDLQKLQEVIATQEALLNPYALGVSKSLIEVKKTDEISTNEVVTEIKKIENLADAQKLEEVIATQEALLKPVTLAESKNLVEVKKTDEISTNEVLTEIKKIENLADAQKLEEVIATQEALLKPVTLAESKNLVEVKKTDEISTNEVLTEIKKIENLADAQKLEEVIATQEALLKLVTLAESKNLVEVKKTDEISTNVVVTEPNEVKSNKENLIVNPVTKIENSADVQKLEELTATQEALLKPVTLVDLIEVKKTDEISTNAVVTKPNEAEIIEDNSIVNPVTDFKEIQNFADVQKVEEVVAIQPHALVESKNSIEVKKTDEISTNAVVTKPNEAEIIKGNSIVNPVADFKQIQNIADVQKVEEVVAIQPHALVESKNSIEVKKTDEISTNVVVTEPNQVTIIEKNLIVNPVAEKIENIADVQKLEGVIATQEALLKPDGLVESKSLIEVNKTDEIATQEELLKPDVLVESKNLIEAKKTDEIATQAALLKPEGLVESKNLIEVKKTDEISTNEAVTESNEVEIIKTNLIVNPVAEIDADVQKLEEVVAAQDTLALIEVKKTDEVSTNAVVTEPNEIKINKENLIVNPVVEINKVKPDALILTENLSTNLPELNKPAEIIPTTKPDSQDKTKNVAEVEKVEKLSEFLELVPEAENLPDVNKTIEIVEDEDIVDETPRKISGVHITLAHANHERKGDAAKDQDGAVKNDNDDFVKIELKKPVFTGFESEDLFSSSSGNNSEDTESNKAEKTITSCDVTINPDTVTKENLGAMCVEASEKDQDWLVCDSQLPKNADDDLAAIETCSSSKETDQISEKEFVKSLLLKEPVKIIQDVDGEPCAANELVIEDSSPNNSEDQGTKFIEMSEVFTKLDETDKINIIFKYKEDNSSVLNEMPKKIVDLILNEQDELVRGVESSKKLPKDCPVPMDDHSPIKKTNKPESIKMRKSEGAIPPVMKNDEKNNSFTLFGITPEEMITALCSNNRPEELAEQVSNNSFGKTPKTVKDTSLLIEDRSPLQKINSNSKEAKMKKVEETISANTVENKENLNLSLFSNSPAKVRSGGRRDTLLTLFDPFYNSPTGGNQNTSVLQSNITSLLDTSLASNEVSAKLICISEGPNAADIALTSCNKIKEDLADESELETFIKSLPETLHSFKAKMDDAIDEKMRMEQELNKLKLELNQLQQERTTQQLELHQKEEVILKIQGEAQKLSNQYKYEIKQLQDKLNIINEQNNNEEVKLLKEELSKIKERESQLTEKNSKLQDQISSLESSVIHFETTLDRVMKESEKVRGDHDNTKKHLATLEMSFSDVHAKYERTKDIVVAYKHNEEVLAEKTEKFEEIARRYEERYNTLKAHAKAQIDKANKELSAVKDKHQLEINKMTALLRRLEIKCGSIQQALDQKTKECADLAALCDEWAGSGPH